MAVPTITIEEYLSGILINYDIPTSWVTAAMARYGIESGALAFPEDDAEFDRKRDLAEADIFFRAVGLISGGGEMYKIGDRAHSTGAIRITSATLQYWMKRYNYLRELHGEEPLRGDDNIFDATPSWYIKRK